MLNIRLKLKINYLYDVSIFVLKTNYRKLLFYKKIIYLHDIYDDI